MSCKFVIGNVNDPDKGGDTYHHKILRDGTLRTYPKPLGDAVWIYVEGDKLNNAQAFALFCLIMGSQYTPDNGLQEPVIEGEFTSWDEIVKGAKK